MSSLKSRKEDTLKLAQFKSGICKITKEPSKNTRVDLNEGKLSYGVLQCLD